MRYDRGMDKSPGEETIDRRRLERAALAYLERFPASRAGVRQILLRKLRRMLGDAFDPDRAEAAIADLLGRLSGAGLLDDERYGRALARNLLDRGVAPAMLVFRLAARGIERGMAAEIVADLAAERAEDGGDADWEAACAFARRRRLGPWRIGAADETRRMREMAAMGRAGFSRALAVRVLESDPDEDAS